MTHGKMYLLLSHLSFTTNLCLVLTQRTKIECNTPPGEKRKKWYKYLFWFCFDLSVVNSLICMQESPNHRLSTKTGKEQKRIQLEYRTALAQQMIGQYRGIRKRKAPAVTGNCGLAHWPTQFEKPGRCKGCLKNNRRHEVSVGCKQCNIKLCVKNDCFYKYHEELLK